MTCAYDEIYLDDAMHTLGEAFDCGMCAEGLSPQVFTAVFCSSPEAGQFERGVARVVCGMSGDELAWEILAGAGLKPTRVRRQYGSEKSPEYWTGWSLAYTQWVTGLSFKNLFEAEPLEMMIASYYPLHEASEDTFAGIIAEKWNNLRGGSGALRRMRKQNRMTQRALAEASGVKLRAIQLYEQGELDLTRAAASTVESLARILHCDMADLIARPVVLEFDSSR